jgi:phosphoribosylformimino-5-aminoimidazole carboxamide ribotide isomerase
MQIIPAIDLKNKKCVRLLQGEIDKETIYSENPVEMALLWQSKGAKRLHIVDLDGAFTGEMTNFEVIKAIRKAVDMDIDVGGGIRTLERAEILLDAGINKIIFGTVAVKDPKLIKLAADKFADKITVGIDAKDGKVAISGWVGNTEILAEELVQNMEKIGITEFIYTDISKDGMMTGPNLKETQNICKITTRNIIASGGVSCIEDIKNLLALNQKNLTGVITGKAIYDGKLDLEEAIKLVETLHATSLPWRNFI